MERYHIAVEGGDFDRELDANGDFLFLIFCPGAIQCVGCCGECHNGSYSRTREEPQTVYLPGSG